MKKRANGSGSIYYAEGKAKPYQCRVREGTFTDSKGKTQIKYRRIGSYRTQKEADEALRKYLETGKYVKKQKHLMNCIMSG